MLSLSRAGAGGLCAVLLAGPYLLYERDAARVSALLAANTPLRKPLAEFPLALGEWVGKDIPLEEGVARVAGADDYLRRQYRGPRTGETMSVYLAYYGSPRPRVSHHPEICYPAFGWKKGAQSEETIRGAGSSKGRAWPVTVYRFSRGTERVTVVSFYASGGKLTADREDVDAIAHEALASTSGRYFLRVMLSLPGHPPMERVVHATSRFASELLPALDAHLPESLAGGPNPRRE